MTEVAFHVNLPEPLAYTCRLVRKAYERGMTMLVVSDARQMAALDARLWAMRPTDFVPHCRIGENANAWRHSAVVLTDSLARAPDRAFDALVNLSPDWPESFQAFGRVFELVSFGEEDLRAARLRWRAYQNAGIEPKRHEIAA